MAGYANRTVRLEFPDLSEFDDLIYVVMRNPKTVPPDDLRAAGNVPAGADGEPETEAAMRASYQIFSRLVVSWHVYDATSNDENQPLLGLPATPADVAKLPLEILNAMGEELAKVNPQTPTEAQGAGTSKT
jgi:hypothetical protein